MTVKNWFAASILLPGLCLATLPVLAQQQQGSQASPAPQAGDPVADAARKAREQQKAAPKPKKVYTDDDVKPATPSPDAGPAPGSGGAQAAPGGGPAAATGSTSGDDAEKAWRKRFQDLRDKVAAAEKELDILQREDDKAQLQYYNNPTKAMNEQYTRKDINDKNAKIAQKQQQIADLHKQHDDLEEELRRSGGDPGWAR